MAGIDANTLRAAVDEYGEREAFVVVEDERLETMPPAFADGSYLWKDVEWIVRWYCRRPLESGPRPAEEAIRENGMDDVATAIDAALEANEPAERINALIALEGLDVPIASAFLQFMAPDRFTTVDARSWTALYTAGELFDPYPETLLPGEYAGYLSVCRRLADEADLRVVDVGRALWRLGRDGVVT